MGLFNVGTFTLHSGASSNFLIDANALTSTDLASLAAAVAPRLAPFGSVLGIPNGGLRFAEALRPYATDGPRLVVDDVTTTGASFREVMQEDDKGVAIFNRGSAVPNVLSVFHLA